VLYKGRLLSASVPLKDNSIFDKAKAGEFDKARLTEFADMVELLFKYSDQQVLLSGTYDDQLAKWAQGKTAFITQGNWIDPSLPTYKASFGCGIAPLAFTKTDMTSVLADCPSWWCVYKDGKQVLETPVVTGRPGTTTIPGAYASWNKESPSTLKGYNPHTQKEYQQPVDYWIPFDDTGQGIHDANWQASFGGEAYLSNGSLGCINTPPGTMAEVYQLVEVGMPVIIF